MNKYTVTEQFVTELTKNQSRLYAYILSIMGNIEDARDIQQEVNRTILQKAESFQPGTNFAAWACQIAFYKVRSYWRDKDREKILFDDDLLKKMSQPLGKVLEKGYDDQLSALNQCLKKLPADKQQMLKQRYRDMMPLGDLAEYWNRSYKAAVVMLSRLRLRLLDCIEKTIAAEEQA